MSRATTAAGGDYEILHLGDVALLSGETLCDARL